MKKFLLWKNERRKQTHLLLIEDISLLNVAGNIMAEAGWIGSFLLIYTYFSNEIPSKFPFSYEF
jgi:hypothetical protein